MVCMARNYLTWAKITLVEQKPSGLENISKNNLITPQMKTPAWTPKSWASRQAPRLVKYIDLVSLRTKEGSQAGGSQIDLDGVPYGLYGVNYIDLVSLAHQGRLLGQCSLNT